MKTPEEIKKGLKPCESAPFYCEFCACEFRCKVEADALAYIQQLEAELKAYKWYEGEQADEQVR